MVYRTEITVDNSNIDSDLSHFPIPLVIGTSVGQDSDDVSFIFDELAFGPVDDDFTGSNGSAPNSTLWTETDTNNKLAIYNNTLYFDSQEATDQDTRITSKYNFIGNFDIQVDVSELNGGNPSSSYHHSILQLSATGFFAQVMMSRGTAGKVFVVYSTAVSFTTISRTIDITKLRFTRSGTTLKAYYWSGTQWEWNGDTNGYTFTDSISAPLSVILRIKQEGDGTTRWNSSMDNFTVNSGDITWPNGHPNRKKIKVTDSTEMQLYVEVEQFDELNEKALLWVSKSNLTLSDTGTTNLNLYFPLSADNTAYVGDPGDSVAANVWDSNFIGVYHMSQDPAGGANSIKDSTSNGHHATPVGSMTLADLVDGLIGKALDFDGIDDFLEINETAPHMTGSFTWEVFYYSEIFGNSESPRLISANTSDGYNRFLTYLFRNTSGTAFLRFNEPVTLTYYLEGIYEEVWKTFALTLNNSTSAAKIINDGVDVTASMTPTLSGVSVPTRIASTDLISIGQEYDTGGPVASDFFEGRIAEVRLSNIDRSAAWLKATHYSLIDDLLTWGSQETVVNENAAPVILFIGL